VAVTRRVRLTLAYDGTAYAGWQRQGNAVTVQEAVERALRALTGEAPETLGLTGASRTDAGVHALGQAAHFDTASRIPTEKFPYALNTLLPRDIRALAADDAEDGFHARFSARGKQYRYDFHRAPHAPALQRAFRWHVPYPLDTDLMRGELDSALGKHDFRAFAASGGQAKTTVRTIRMARLETGGADKMGGTGDTEEAALLRLWVEGDAFLYNMVRILAGTLADVGMGRLPPGAVARALASGDRLDLGQTAPAHGLALTRVFYA